MFCLRATFRRSQPFSGTVNLPSLVGASALFTKLSRPLAASSQRVCRPRQLTQDSPRRPRTRCDRRRKARIGVYGCNLRGERLSGLDGTTDGCPCSPPGSITPEGCGIPSATAPTTIADAATWKLQGRDDQDRDVRRPRFSECRGLNRAPSRFRIPAVRTPIALARRGPSLHGASGSRRCRVASGPHRGATHRARAMGPVSAMGTLRSRTKPRRSGAGGSALRFPSTASERTTPGTVPGSPLRTEEGMRSWVCSSIASS